MPAAPRWSIALGAVLGLFACTAPPAATPAAPARTTPVSLIDASSPTVVDSGPAPRNVTCSVALESVSNLMRPLVTARLRIDALNLSRDLFDFFPSDLTARCSGEPASDGRSLELSCPDVGGPRVVRLALEPEGLRLTSGTPPASELLPGGTECTMLATELPLPNEPGPATSCLRKGPRNIEARFRLEPHAPVPGLSHSGKVLVLVAPALGLRRVFVDQVFEPYRCDGSVETQQRGMYMGCMFDDGGALARVSHVGDELWLDLRSGPMPPGSAAKPPERVALPCGASVRFVPSSPCTAGCGAPSSGL